MLLLYGQSTFGSASILKEMRLERQARSGVAAVLGGTVGFGATQIDPAS